MARNIGCISPPPGSNLRALHRGQERTWVNGGSWAISRGQQLVVPGTATAGIRAGRPRCHRRRTTSIRRPQPMKEVQQHGLAKRWPCAALRDRRSRTNPLWKPPQPVGTRSGDRAWAPRVNNRKPTLKQLPEHAMSDDRAAEVVIARCPGGRSAAGTRRSAGVRPCIQ